MSRVQLALNVSDIDAAVDHYTKLFDTEPNKLKPGYANFAIVEPPLKLVLFENADEAGTLNHLGTEVESTEQVTAAAERLTASGIDTKVEDTHTCCYASQDKTWTTDPDGVDWEVYTVVADSDEPGRDSRDAGGDEVCCAPTGSKLVSNAAACCG